LHWHLPNLVRNFAGAGLGWISEEWLNLPQQELKSGTALDAS